MNTVVTVHIRKHVDKKSAHSICIRMRQRQDTITGQLMGSRKLSLLYPKPRYGTNEGETSLDH